jgi:hypothetical protein
MTKGLPSRLFLEFRSSLCVREPPAEIAWGRGVLGTIIVTNPNCL